MILTIKVPGIAQPAGSKRAFRRGERIIVTDANAKARPWKDRVITEARLILGGAAALEGPLRLSVTFGMPRPKGHYGKKGLRASAPLFPASRPDFDKLLRAVCDSLTEAAIWRDDGQVTEAHAFKVYAEQPETVIEVSRVDTGPDPR